ncbi:MAG: hypothetical protein KDC98_26220, partial [Planctomycetes bacterium]|nr:hypothetical protein [Planctomycetota bacterium]
RNVFVSVYQSIDDPQVPPGPNQFATKALAQAHERWGGFAHDYWEVDGRGHGAPPGGHVAQLEKIAARTRTAIPEQLVWQPVLTWKRQFHWLWWETPPAGAIVEADLDRERNSVSIRCDKATDGLFVLLDDRVLDLQREVVVTVNGKETFRGTVTASLEMLLRTSHHPDSRLQFTARAPAH